MERLQRSNHVAESLCSSGQYVQLTDYEATDPALILGGGRFFPGSDAADAKRSESRGGYSSAIKTSAVKSSCSLLFFKHLTCLCIQEKNERSSITSTMTAIAAAS